MLCNTSIINKRDYKSDINDVFGPLKMIPCRTEHSCSTVFDPPAERDLFPSCVRGSRGAAQSAQELVYGEEKKARRKILLKS